MDQNSTYYCNINIYFDFSTSLRCILLLPGLCLNMVIFTSVMMCLQGKEKKIKKNIVGFILGITICNIVNMSLWPLMIDWHSHRMWRLGLTFCEIMVNIKQITSTLSFCYVSFISFSIYTDIVCGWKIVNHKLFLAFELLSPLLPVFIEELSEHLLGMKNGHYDSVNHTCFTNLNDKTMKIRMLMKISVFLPLTMYFYIHILHTVFKSARRTHRNQDTNIRLTKIFSAIFLITLAVHTPGKTINILFFIHLSYFLY